MNLIHLRPAIIAFLAGFVAYFLLRRLFLRWHAKRERRRMAELYARDQGRSARHWEEQRLLAAPKKNDPFSVENIPYP